jgi:hypothetical protein
VLQAVEGSRLLLHCPAGATQTRLRQWFEAQGIAAHRLDLVPRTATRAEFLELFQRIDIGLDPFPYNGGTTTCEALWMGVPVVSLAGRTAVSRLGLSVLTNAGLPELVAFSEEDYVRIAAQLAHDLPRLAELRATLRPRMQASPLMDAPRFARNMEAAYRTMWQRWCHYIPPNRRNRCKTPMYPDARGHHFTVNDPKQENRHQGRGDCGDRCGCNHRSQIPVWPGAFQCPEHSVARVPSPTSGAADAEPTVELAASQLQAIKIELVGTYGFPVEKSAVGSIDFDEDLSVQVFRPTRGRSSQAYRPARETWCRRADALHH